MLKQVSDARLGRLSTGIGLLLMTAAWQATGSEPVPQMSAARFEKIFLQSMPDRKRVVEAVWTRLRMMGNAREDGRGINHERGSASNTKYG